MQIGGRIPDMTPVARVSVAWQLRCIGAPFLMHDPSRRAWVQAHRQSRLHGQEGSVPSHVCGLSRQNLSEHETVTRRARAPITKPKIESYRTEVDLSFKLRHLMIIDPDYLAQTSGRNDGLGAVFGHFLAIKRAEASRRKGPLDPKWSDLEPRVLILRLCGST